MKAVIAITLALLLFSPARAQEGRLAIRAATVLPVDGPAIEDGVVLVRDSRIERVGPAVSVRVPDGYRVLETAVVTPGLVDARTTLGLSGLLNQETDQDHLDKTAPLQPELRALDAYDARSELVAWARSFGVTTVQTGPSPGAVIGGQMLVVKTHLPTVDAALVDTSAMVAMAVGEGPGRNFESPGTRAKAVALLRSALLEAQQYARKRAEGDSGATDLGKEVLADVLSGRRRALITAHRAHDILTALRIAREFDLDAVLSGASEAYLVLDEIREAGVPVFLHPTMARASGERENLAFDTAARLAEAGIPFAIQSGYEAYVPKTRVVLFEAAIAAAYGLGRDRALQAITLDAARILGLAGRIGSITPGKDADLVLYDGDPFEYTTHVCAVIVGGTVVEETCR